jgi:hypothetical protein
VVAVEVHVLLTLVKMQVVLVEAVQEVSGTMTI